MEAWQTILLAFGGNAALIAVLAFIAKSFLDKLIVRDTKQFEADIKAKADAEIERLRNDLLRSVESYKVQLKKSEFFFEREYAAAAEFTSVVRSVIPRSRYPEQIWEDALDLVCENFEKTEHRLDAFLTAYAPVLTDEERKLLRSAISTANDGMFHSGGSGDPVGHQMADSLINKLYELESRLIKRVRDQASL
jgi:hypothetical protein